MAILNNLEDVNALLTSKGLNKVEVEGYDLKVTEDRLKEESVTTTKKELSIEQELIHKSMQDVIQHYGLDEVEGYYGVEHRNEKEAERQMALIHQKVYYQVLNQKRILWEFYKRNCYQLNLQDYLTRFEELYRLGLADVDGLVV